MKRFVAVGLILFGFAVGTTGRAAGERPNGSNEIRVDGSYLFGDDELGPAVTASLGWYISDFTVVGAYMSRQETEFLSHWRVGSVWGLGAYGEYILGEGGAVSPFVGASAGLLDGERTSDIVVKGTLSAGFRFALSDSWQLSVQGNFELASDDVWNLDWDDVSYEEREDNEAYELAEGDSFAFSAGVGVRFLF